eukprot:TRINITY_DN17765_c1_g1_i1.p2 TRINITY_DN17765_c1_g1~~TRINITY_DN17765_c1_g1_i1.p2  ORF type:complete len:102 (-),score=16.42 TRINITY_DN17765_c1_g1_i1:221-526(-)
MTTQSGIAVGEKKGYPVTKRTPRVRNNRKKGVLGKKTKFVRSLIREVAGLAPYEKRIIELIKVGRDKRALKVAKKKLGSHKRGKNKREEMGEVYRKMAQKK